MGAPKEVKGRNNKTKGDRKVVVTATNFEHIRKWSSSTNHHITSSLLQFIYVNGVGLKHFHRFNLL